MKAMLKFDLDEYFEKLAFKRATSATDAYLVIFAIQNLLSNAISKDVVIAEIDKKCPEGAVEEILERLSEIVSETLNGYDINMNDLE